MENLFDKGYATKVPEESLKVRDGKSLWYLPHHPVFNPNKPGKLRIVFDCAASYNGTSLPTMVQLLQGPDMICDILQRGGFRLTKWVSNSPKVVASIPEIDRAGSVKDLCPEQPTLERALGVQWNVRLDQFGFKIEIKVKPPTRRGVLSVVSSVYDPLGFAAPFVLLAKMLMQDLCRENFSWDDVLQGDYLKRWESWLEQLMKIEKLYVPRCFKPPQFGRIVSIQLHVFADASQRGYGAVSYLRFVNELGDIHIAFVIGKARVAPLKVVTIPRLELSAAVVAARLEKMIRSEIDLSIDTTLLWTDSTTVLGYIANKDKTFVANRLAVIHETTEPTQ